MRNIVKPTLPSPGTSWMLNTAFARTVPSDFRSGDTYPTGTGFGGFAIPDIPPNVQFALVCVDALSHVTVKLASFTRGPPALTSADSSKSLPVAVTFVSVHDDVPPPKVIPGFDTRSAEPADGPPIAQGAWGGTSTAVNEAEPMLATPGCGEADEGEEAARPVTTKAVTIVLRISRPPRLRGSGRGGSSSTPEYPPGGDVRCARNLRSPFRGSGTTRWVTVGGVMFVTVSAGQRVNDRAA
ncbi:hypothetical protein [Amycolatopsis mediterranei]|uniref:hypothetical protein n=1 Tax=Amycolatopsis mediterranei TaxID=33910 RepID=UPI00030D0B5B|nr:hypothetical protein [Amycolatopsis mediterranei]UZF67535.1 hypothetical protein ISP_000548 [Amycolatopsis mediterranei]